MGAVEEGIAVALVVHLLAICVASFEIEVEGSHGWAANLPTWRFKTCVCGARPLTGYHVSLSLTMILTSMLGGILHGILFGGLRTAAIILLSLAVFVLVMLFEDSYWFVLNYKFATHLARGAAINHFQTPCDQLKLHAICAGAGSALWIASYGVRPIGPARAGRGATAPRGGECAPQSHAVRE